MRGNRVEGCQGFFTLACPAYPGVSLSLNPPHNQAGVFAPVHRPERDVAVLELLTSIEDVSVAHAELKELAVARDLVSWEWAENPKRDFFRANSPYRPQIELPLFRTTPLRTLAALLCDPQGVVTAEALALECASIRCPQIDDWTFVWQGWRVAISSKSLASTSWEDGNVRGTEPYDAVRTSSLVGINRVELDATAVSNLEREEQFLRAIGRYCVEPASCRSSFNTDFTHCDFPYGHITRRALYDVRAADDFLTPLRVSAAAVSLPSQLALWNTGYALIGLDPERGLIHLGTPTA